MRCWRGMFWFELTSDVSKPWQLHVHPAKNRLWKQCDILWFACDGLQTSQKLKLCGSRFWSVHLSPIENLCGSWNSETQLRNEVLNKSRLFNQISHIHLFGPVKWIATKFISITLWQILKMIIPPVSVYVTLVSDPLSDSSEEKDDSSEKCQWKCTVCGL